MLVYPEREAVTFTLSRLPASSVLGLYLAARAPEIAEPLRYHW